MEPFLLLGTLFSCILQLVNLQKTLLYFLTISKVSFLHFTVVKRRHSFNFQQILLKWNFYFEIYVTVAKTIVSTRFFKIKIKIKSLKVLCLLFLLFRNIRYYSNSFAFKMFCVSVTASKWQRFENCRKNQNFGIVDHSFEILETVLKTFAFTH